MNDHKLISDDMLVLSIKNIFTVLLLELVCSYDCYLHHSPDVRYIGPSSDLSMSKSKSISEAVQTINLLLH